MFRPHFNSPSVIPDPASLSPQTHNSHILCSVLFFIKPPKKQKLTAFSPTTTGQHYSNCPITPVI